MAAKFPITALNGGEIDPMMWGRSDFIKYRSCHRTLDNYIVEPQGAIKRRTGTTIKSRIGDLGTFVDAKIQEWAISITDYFQMIFVNSEIQFFNPNGVKVFTLAIPYSPSDFDELYFRQTQDFMFVTHPDYAVRIITRTAQFTWELTEAIINGGPYGTINGDTLSTVSVALNTSPFVTVTASDPIFASTDIGRQFRTSHPDPINDSDTYGSVTQTSTPLPATGLTVTMTTGGTWTGTISLELSLDNQATWQSIGSVTSKNNLNNVVVEEIIQYGAFVRISYVGTSGSINWTLETSGILYNNYVITGYTSDTIVTAEVVAGFFEVLTNSWEWGLGAFSETTGYPTCSEIFDERLLLSGVEAYPSEVYTSEIGFWENFQSGFFATSPFKFTMLDDIRNRARWFAIDQQLVIGTDNAPFSIGSRNNAQAISVSNILVQKQPQVGTDPVQPIRADDTTYFIEAGGKRIRDFSYFFDRDRYVSKDMSILAPHLTKNAKIVKIAFTLTPDRVIYMLLDSGLLLSFTTEPAQNVNAWSKHPLYKNTVTENPESKQWIPEVIGTVIDINSILTPDGNVLGMIIERQDGIYYETSESSDECIDALTVFDNITVNDCLALPGREDFTYWNSIFIEKEVPYSGLGSFLRLDIDTIENLIVKYDGVEITLGTSGKPEDYAQVRDNKLYWLPNAPDETLITVFNFITPVDPADYYVTKAEDTMVVQIKALSPIFSTVIKSTGTPLILDTEYFEMSNDQYLLIDPKTTDTVDITVDVELVVETALLNDDGNPVLSPDDGEILVETAGTSGALPVDEYDVFNPRILISIFTDPTPTAYFGLKILSLAELVDQYNAPEIGGGLGGTRNVKEIDVFVVDSVAFDITGNANDGTNTSWQAGKFVAQEPITDQKVPLFTGKIKVHTKGGYTSEANVGIRSDSPYCHIISQIAPIGVKTSDRSTK